MVRASVSASVAFAAAAAAVNQPLPVPLDAQIGLLAFPVTCMIYGFANQTFNTVFTATAPVYGGSGQEIYYTDVVGNIDIPSTITGLAPLVGAKQATANVSAFLALDNATPKSILAYHATISNISFPSSGDANIRIPPGTGTLPPLGPVALGTAGVPHRIHLGEVTVDLELLDGSGNNAFGPVNVQCPIQNIDYILGSVDVDNSQGPPLMPSNGFVPNFPATPNLAETGAFRFPYDCTFGSLGNYVLDLQIEGTIPAYFAPGAQFSLSNARSFLRVPENLTSLAKSAFPQATTFETTIYDFEILFQNAQPAALNVAKTPIQANIAISDDLIIPIPPTGSLTVGPVTAGSDGQVVAVAVGSANASVVVTDASGNSLITLPVTCNVPAPLELIGVPITSQKPDNYSLGTNNNNGGLFASSTTTSATSATLTGTAASSSATGSICFDDGDCILSGGKCVHETSTSITGTCQK